MGRCRRRPFRRLGVLGAALVAAVLLAPPAAAQDDAEPGSEGTLGSAKATAVVVRAAPTVGSLALALGSGISVAEVRNNVAQSQSQSLDLGLIGSTLTAEGCDGSEASLRPSDLPQPLRVDNRQGEASDTASFIPVPGLLDGLLQEVRATPSPFAEAVSTTARVAFNPLLHLTGGRSSAITEVVDGGAARVARAHVGVDLEIPGLLKLANLQWDAYHRTGTDPDARAGFTFGDIEVLGQRLPVSDLPIEALIGTVDDLLNPLGVSVRMPRVERFTEPADVVRITPLQIRFGDSPITSQLIGPILDLTRQLRDDLAARIIELSCKASTAFLVAEIVIGQLAGTGSTVVSIGGAEATTGLVLLDDPFGDDGLLAPSVTEVADGGGGAAGPGRPVTVPPAGARPAAPAPVADVPTTPIGSFERVCESVHPFAWPKCSEGAAPFVGIAAVLATVAIAAVDWRHQRRRARAGAEGAP